MINVIRFLEEMGRNADLRLDRVDFETIVDSNDFDAETRDAILKNDNRSLEVLLNARSKIVCMIMPAEDDEEDKDKEEENEDEGTKKNDSEEENANFIRQIKQLSQAS